MYIEIGGNFWCDTSEIKNYNNVEINFAKFKNIKFRDIEYFSSGRNAIGFILDSIEYRRDKRALLPIYTCTSVIKPFIDRGYYLEFYDIDINLEVNIKDFEEKIISFKPSIVLFHAYYGFDTLKDIKDKIMSIRKKNIIIIEDITQSFMSDIKHIDADYYIGSFRKWVAVPDGGFAINKNDFFPRKPININKKLVDLRLQAFYVKYNYMKNNIGSKEDFIKLYIDSEEMFDDSFIYKISSEAKFILNNCNKQEIIEKRKNNFSRLLKGIDGKKSIMIPVFRSMPKNIIPLYFPIYVEGDRDDLRKYLSINNIYAPVIWPIPCYIKNISNNILNIYQKILAIPCDQRYGLQDMDSVVEILLKYKG